MQTFLKQVSSYKFIFFVGIYKAPTYIVVYSDFAETVIFYYL